MLSSYCAFRCGCCHLLNRFQNVGSNIPDGDDAFLLPIFWSNKLLNYNNYFMQVYVSMFILSNLLKNLLSNDLLFCDQCFPSNSNSDIDTQPITIQRLQEERICWVVITLAQHTGNLWDYIKSNRRNKRQVNWFW